LHFNNNYQLGCFALARNDGTSFSPRQPFLTSQHWTFKLRGNSNGSCFQRLQQPLDFRFGVFENGGQKHCGAENCDIRLVLKRGVIAQLNQCGMQHDADSLGAVTEILRPRIIDQWHQHPQKKSGPSASALVQIPQKKNGPSASALVQIPQKKNGPSASALVPGC